MTARQLGIAVRGLRQPPPGHELELHGEAGSDES